MSSVMTKHTVLYPVILRNTSKFKLPGCLSTASDHKSSSLVNTIDCRLYRSHKSNSYIHENATLFVRPKNDTFSNTTTEVLTKRYMSSNEQHDLPALSELPRRVFPHFMHYMRSLFFIHGLIVPFFDDEFTKETFMDGAVKAVEVVSNALSEGDFESLEPIVEKKCLDDIKRKLSFSTAQQREKLKVQAENIYGQFLYEVGIMFDDDEQDMKKQRRWVEITFVAHSHPDFNSKFDEKALSVVQESVRHKGSVVKASVKKLQDLVESNGGPMVLNYRFLREFTKGVDPSSTHWSISAVNHFRINDINN